MHCHCGTKNRAPRWTFTDPCKPEVRPGAREESISIKTIRRKIMEKIKNEEKLSNRPLTYLCNKNMHYDERTPCIAGFDQMWVTLFKMVSLMLYRKNIMRILGHIIFYRKLKTNSMSNRADIVENITTQKDHKRQKWDFHWSTPPPLVFSFFTHNTMLNARNILQI